MKGQYEDITGNIRGKKYQYKYKYEYYRMLTLYVHSGEVTHFENKD